MCFSLLSSFLAEKSAQNPKVARGMPKIQKIIRNSITYSLLNTTNEIPITTNAIANAVPNNTIWIGFMLPLSIAPKIRLPIASLPISINTVPTVEAIVFFFRFISSIPTIYP